MRDDKRLYQCCCHARTDLHPQTCLSKCWKWTVIMFTWSRWCSSTAPGLLILLMAQMSPVLKVIRTVTGLRFYLCPLACLRASVSVHMCMSPCQTFLPSCARNLPISAFQFLICWAREREWKRERRADGGVKERRKIDEPIGIKFGGSMTVSPSIHNNTYSQYWHKDRLTGLCLRIMKEHEILMVCLVPHTALS